MDGPADNPWKVTMMRRIALPLAAAALAATAPLALSAPGAAGITKAPAVAGDTSIGYQSHGKATKKKIRTAAALRKAKADRRKRARRAKPVNLVLKGCVVEDVLGDAVELEQLDGNKPMRRLLDDADTFTALLGPETRVVLSEAAQADRGADTALGSTSDIWAGDRIVVRWRLARGAAVDALPAMRVINQGQHEDCLPEDWEDELPEDGDGELPEEEIIEEPPTDDPLAGPAEEVDDDDEHEEEDEDDHRRGRR
jgi:hypothetical protein